MSQPAIKVEGLSKFYKLYASPLDRMKEALYPFKHQYHQIFYALQNINFQINQGETLGIIGKNGAGKSTLLKLLTGVLTPSHGSIEINGRVSALLELGAGFNLEYTGLENIYFQGNLLGINRKEMNLQLKSIIDFADIGDFIHQKVKTYSSGMFARLAFAIAIHVEPNILIIDEALAVGDANFQLKCHQRMNELRAQGVTILFVSHDTYSIKTLCSRAIFLNHGQQQTYGLAVDVVNDYLLFLDQEQKNTAPTVNSNPELLPQTLARIHQVTAINQSTSEQGSVRCKTNQPLLIEINYEIVCHKLQDVVFVFNLYRERDGVYICGTTTLMDGLAPIKVIQGKQRFQFKLPSLPLLSGRYRIRIAINDSKGLGIITESKEALLLDVIDHHEAEGVISLPREWIL